MRYFALLMLALNPIFWASFYAVTKRALSDIDPIAFSFMELCVAALPAFLLVCGLKREFNLAVLRRGIFLGVVLYGAVLASAIALYFTTATVTTFFPALSGGIGACIGAIFLRQKPSGLTIFSGVLSVFGCGLLVCLVPDTGTVRLGDLIALLATCLYTAYIFCVGEGAAARPGELVAIFVIELLTMTCLAGVIWLIVSFFHHQPADPLVFHLTHLKLVIYVGLFTTFLPTAIALYFQPYVNSVTVSFLYALEPVWGAVAAHFIDHETLPWLAYGAGVLIVLGALLETARGLRGAR